jgi:hypothetical protein
MQFDNTIGGRVYELMSKTTYKDVELVNNSKLTEDLQNQRSFPQKEQQQLAHLQIAPWTS